MDEVGERAERLLDVGVGLGAVYLVEVDPVGFQTFERALDLFDDPAPRVAGFIWIPPAPLAHRAVELGREHDIVAAPGERLADDLLGLALRVDVGGVHEVDSGVERRVDDPDRVVVIGVAPGAEHHRPETQRADLDSGASQRAVLHGFLLSPSSSSSNFFYSLL